MFRHILPVFPSAKFSQKIPGQIMPRVKNVPGQKCPRSKMPQVKNASGQKCPWSKNAPGQKLPISKNDRVSWIVKTPAYIKHLSVWLGTAFPTDYMTLDKLLRTVMSFLCHFQQFYASRRQVSITGFLTKWFTGLDSPIPVLFPVDIDYLSINNIKSGS